MAKPWFSKSETGVRFSVPAPVRVVSDIEMMCLIKSGVVAVRSSPASYAGGRGCKSHPRYQKAAVAQILEPPIVGERLMVRIHPAVLAEVA